MRAQYILCLLLLLFLSGCGYFSSGTWEDDPNNWARAFQTEKPADVITLHSKYWRSPHWTLEFSYFFEIQHNSRLEQQLFTQNKLVKVTGSATLNAKRIISGAPSWFVPKTLDKYDVWIFADGPESHFGAFIDKETGNLFLTDYQV